MMKGLGLLSVIVLSLGIPLSASTIGTFNMSGTIIVNGFSNITWKSDLSPFDANMFTLTAGTGAYSTEDGQNSIADLNNPPEVVGSFADTTFITFDVDPSVGTLDINQIVPGIYSDSACTTLPAAAGQHCTPAGSPFNFTNNSPTSSTASFTFKGVTTDGDPWTALFTSQFVTESYQDVLAGLASSGSVTASYSAAEVTVSSVPEPSSTSMLGIGAGLLLVSISLKKYQRT